MKLDSLHTLYIEQLQDMYNAETQLVEALPLMVQAIHNRDLKQVINDYLAHTDAHVRRL